MARPSPYVVALDAGTSSVRALLFDRHARPVRGAEAHLPYQPRVDQRGMAEVPVGKLIALVERALDQLLEKAGRRPIAAVGLSTFWHGLLAADEHGKALTPVYLWSDTRAGRAARELEQRVDAEAVRQRTGCTIHPSYWPAKLQWLREEQPELWRHRVRWLSFADLLHERLFGRAATSISMASATGLLRLPDMRWDAELLSVLGIEAAQLPAIESSPGLLMKRHARRWPALADASWAPAAGDGALANLGSGCVDPSLRALTVGTSGALRILTAQRPKKLPKGIWCYRLDARRYVVGASFNNGGNLYAWLVRNLDVDERTLESSLKRLEPCAHGLTFVPLLAGERSPGFAAHATGAIAGLTQATTAVDIVRAGLEAVAIEFARANALLNEIERRPQRLVASGAGLLSSPAWMQMMADAIGLRVTASRAREASSRGAAMLALESLGLLDPSDLDPGGTRDYEPNPKARPAYSRAIERQQALYRALVSDAILESDAVSAHLQVRSRLG